MNFEIDHSLTTFTSEGKLNQCEFALKAASNGTLSIGCASEDGVVLSSLKLYPSLVNKSKIYKVNIVCSTIGMTYSGLQPDYRVIYDKACNLAESYKNIYGRYPYVDVFVHNLSRVIQEYTQKGGLRPFGTLLLVTGYIKDVPILYQLEPSGSFSQLEVGGIGKENANAIKFVENRKEMLDDNVVTIVKALREFSGCNIDHNDIDVGILKDNQFKIIKRDQVKEIFDLLEQK